MGSVRLRNSDLANHETERVSHFLAIPSPLFLIHNFSQSKRLISPLKYLRRPRREGGPIYKLDESKVKIQSVFLILANFDLFFVADSPVRENSF